MKIRAAHLILLWSMVFASVTIAAPKVETGAELARALALAGAVTTLTSDPNFKTANGISVYLGVVPAAIVRGHPQSHPEAKMHGGPSQSSVERHVVIALFDGKTFERIIDANITATVEGLGHVGRTTKKLERMDIADAPTFGGYFPFAGVGKFTIRLEIRTPRRASPTIVEFAYQT